MELMVVGKDSRPTMRSPEVFALSARLMFDAMGRDASGSLEQLIEAMSCTDSGFGLAKELESRGWQVTDLVAETLSNRWSYLSDAAHKAEREWVASRGMKPLNKVGDTIQLTEVHGLGESRAVGTPWETRLIEAEVVDVWERHAHYLVRCKPPGPPHDLYVAFEVVHAIERGVLA